MQCPLRRHDSTGPVRCDHRFKSVEASFKDAELWTEAKSYMLSEAALPARPSTPGVHIEEFTRNAYDLMLEGRSKERHARIDGLW